MADPDPADLEEFNAWWASEYLPGRRARPGVVSVRRYVGMDGAATSALLIEIEGGTGQDAVPAGVWSARMSAAGRLREIFVGSRIGEAHGRPSPYRTGAAVVLMAEAPADVAAVVADLESDPGVLVTTYASVGGTYPAWACVIEAPVWQMLPALDGVGLVQRLGMRPDRVELAGVYSVHWSGDQAPR